MRYDIRFSLNDRHGVSWRERPGRNVQLIRKFLGFDISLNIDDEMIEGHERSERAKGRGGGQSTYAY